MIQPISDSQEAGNMDAHQSILREEGDSMKPAPDMARLTRHNHDRPPARSEGRPIGATEATAMSELPKNRKKSGDAEVNLPDQQVLEEASQNYANRHDVEIILYTGPLLEKGFDRLVNVAGSSAKNVLLVLITLGGTADAAYKCARYLQNSYSKFSVLIPGYCKSAGTILAIGAHEIIMTPFGELGPLDVQVSKPDELHARKRSGANLMSALNLLEERCFRVFSKYVPRIISSAGGNVSLRTSMELAAAFSGNLYQPIFRNLDADYIGKTARDMRIAVEYAQRLSETSRSIDGDGINTLVYGYPHHEFVIDVREAQKLFKNVLKADQEIMSLLEERLGRKGLPSPSLYDIVQLAAPGQPATLDT